MKNLKRQFKDSNQRTAHYDVYKVDTSDKKIFMDVFPGDTGESAVSDVFLESEKIIDGKLGSVEEYEVGTNASLRGKNLEVYTVVADIAGEPDLTSFRFRLNGGLAPYEYYMEKTVQEQGESVGYKMTIFFTIH